MYSSTFWVLLSIFLGAVAMLCKEQGITVLVRAATWPPGPAFSVYPFPSYKDIWGWPCLCGILHAFIPLLA